MIRAKMMGQRSTDGAVREVMFLGLSDLNIERLTAGQPIKTEMDDIGFPGLDVLITHGQTENDIMQDLEIIARRKL